MFKITDGKGFHITFENGWTASVQFGSGNYCDNRDEEISRDGYVRAGKRGSKTAEIAAWPKESGLYDFGWGDTVKGYCEPDEVVVWLATVAAMQE